MIRVFVDTDLMIFKMSGHAGYAPTGSDIVCAAATMLASTLIQSVTKKVDSSEVLECRLDSGYAQLKVSPIKRKVRNECRVVFAAILEGFELLAARYPDNIIID